MILKSGQQAPLTVLWICEVLESVLPKDIIQVVPDMGHRGATSPHYTSPSQNGFHGKLHAGRWGDGETFIGNHQTGGPRA